MKAIKRILKINIYGQLLQYNSKSRRWESTLMSWNWNDIHEDYLEESKQNWDDYFREKCINN